MALLSAFLFPYFPSVSLLSFRIERVQALVFAATALAFAVALPASYSIAESKAPSKLGSIRDPSDQAPDEDSPSSTMRGLEEISEAEFPGLPKTLGWELILSQKAYKVAPTIRTTSDLLTVLAKSIEHSCLGELQRTLSYYPPPTDPGCLKLLDVLAQIDAKNPLLTCTKLGFDTQECRDAYAYQETTDKIPESFIRAQTKSAKDANSAYAFRDELQVKLASEKSAKNIGILRSEIDKASSALRGARDKTAGMAISGKLDDLIWKYLQLSCNPYRIVLFPQEYADSVEKPAYRAATNRRTGSLEDILKKGPFNEEVVASKQKIVTPRFRLVSDTCTRNLTYAKSILPTAAAIPCLGESAVSPACIQARKAAPTKAANGPRNPAYEGMEAF